MPFDLISDRRRFPFAGLLRRALELLEGGRLFAAHIVGNATEFVTIQAAVDAAAAGSVINVDAGVYPELVTISKTLTLRGARFGADARSNVRSSSTAGESVVSGF